MNRRIYSFRYMEQKYELYVDHCSAVSGLLVFSPESPVAIVLFGATLYKRYGWATENELPKFNQVGQLIEHLSSEADVGLFELEVAIAGVCDISVYNDQQCVFRFDSRKLGISKFEMLIPENHSRALMARVLDAPGFCFSFDKDGNVKCHGAVGEYQQ